MQSRWGKYTVYGSSEVEHTVSSIVREVAVRVDKSMESENLRCLVLFGGYGRGEGGVEIQGDSAIPHNNLDFLVITKKITARQQDDYVRQLNEAIQPIRERFGVGVDITAISDKKLKSAPSLVMWYDMRFGHKTVLGDANFVPSLKKFDLPRIPAWNVRDLMVNRGTLIVINDYLIDELGDQLSMKGRRSIIKHAMKAIIGYGDSLLYFLNDYHWSYSKKQTRMKGNTRVGNDFKELYDEAISFRFQPNYEPYMERDLAAWMDELRAQLKPVHLACEAKRLNKPSLTWEEYFDTALRHAMWEDLTSARGIAKKARNILQGAAIGKHRPFAARLGGRSVGLTGCVPIVYPVLSFFIEDEQYRFLAGDLLGEVVSSTSELRRLYLKRWGMHGDTNFSSFLREHAMSVEVETAEAQL
jgi:hypothetical protein